MTRHIMLLLKIYYNCVDNLKSQNSVIFNIKFSFILALIMNLSFGFQEKKGGKKEGDLDIRHDEKKIKKSKQVYDKTKLKNN